MNSRLWGDKSFRKALVIGGGISGFGASLLLRKLGVAVTLSDQQSVNATYHERLINEGVEVFDKGHQMDHINNCDLVIASPGVPASNILLQIAVKNQLLILSEIDLSLGIYPGKIIGITGTNGKSTICSMTEHALNALGFNAKAGGNFGDPPSLMIAENRAPSILVLELSSYQLELSRHFQASSVSFSNFSPDHLARHGTIEEYFKIKWSIFERLNKDGLGVLTEKILEMAKSLKLPIPKKYVTIDDTSFQSKSDYFTHFSHNIINAKTSLALIRPFLDDSSSKIDFALDNFKGLPYRCEKICEFQGFAIYNDSKSTNVASSISALKGFSQNIVLMLGGQGKGESFEPIKEYKNIIRHLVTFGHSGKSIYNELSEFIPSSNFNSLREAILFVKDLLKNTGSPLLFSPGCASFDEFKNYEHRGSFFNQQFLGETN
jgi:UDP-N-acetylmuramoylalanine--D-glutamate ligase